MDTPTRGNSPYAHALSRTRAGGRGRPAVPKPVIAVLPFETKTTRSEEGGGHAPTLTRGLRPGVVAVLLPTAAGPQGRLDAAEAVG